MAKSPIEYFEEQIWEASPEGFDEGFDFSEAEKRFLEKYIGLLSDDAEHKGFMKNFDASTLPDISESHSPQMSDMLVACGCKALLDEAKAREEKECKLAQELEKTQCPSKSSWDTKLQKDEESALMRLNVEGQSVVLPALAVIELMRATKPTIVPMMSSAAVGLVNVRQRVTPLVMISKLMKPESLEQQVDENTVQEEAIELPPYIAICQSQGLQFGLYFDNLESMLSVKKEDMRWDLAQSFGVNETHISALCIQGKEILPLISLDRIVATILQ